MGSTTTKWAMLAALDRSSTEEWPFRHWRVRDFLDRNTLEDLKAWPHAAPSVHYAEGRREENNPTRRYFDAETLAADPAARKIAEALQDEEVTSALAALCGISLSGTSLRIEYAQDREGFWLEPHTDIGVKMFTMFVYLDDGERERDWGTDLFLDESRHAVRLPFIDNSGMIFVPDSTTWHGFRPRPIDGVRRSLIINYVTHEWRNRHELAWPEQPVG